VRQAAAHRGHLRRVIALLLWAAPAAAQENHDNNPAYETVVVAPASEPVGAVPESVRIIGREEIERSGATTVQEVLGQLAAAAIADEQGGLGQADLSLRGLVASPVTGLSQGVSVFVDGVRVNEPTVEEVNFDLLPLAEVERIEIVRGPGRLTGRNTLGGSINLVTRRAAENGLGASAGFGSFLQQRYRIWADGRKGAFDGSIAVGHTAERGYREQARGRATYVFAKGGYRGEHIDITLSHQLQLDRLEQPGSLPESLLTENRRRNYSGGDFFRPTLNHTTLLTRRSFGPSWSMAVTGHFRRLDVVQFNVNRSGEDSQLESASTTYGEHVELFHRARYGAVSSRLAIGGEGAFSRVRVSVLEGEDEQLSSRLSDDQRALGASVQQRLTLGEEVLGAGRVLRLALGARADHIHHDIVDTSPDEPDKASGQATFSRITPAAALTYDTPRFAVSVSYAHGFRAPAFLELTCADAQSPCVGLQSGVAPDTGFGDLRPVRARSYEVGATLRPMPWAGLQVVAFRMDLLDDIFSVAPANTVQVYFQNVGDTRREGAETRLTAAVGTVSGEAGYSYVRATFRSSLALPTPRAPGMLQTVSPGNELPLSPRHRADLAVSWRPLPWLGLGAQAIYTGAQRLRGDEANTDQALPGYTLVGASVTVWRGGCSASLRATNLLDVQPNTFGTYAPNALAPAQPIERFLTPAPPLSAFGSVGCRFF
jgi:iron complex outermembrane recepter protein